LGQGTDHVYIGNTVANSTREHVVRMNGVERLLVANNNFSNENRQNIDGSDIAKGAIEVHEVKYAYVTGNTVHDGALRAGPRGGGVEDASTSTDYVVIEDNTVIGVSITLRPGAHHVMIRNNMINFEGNEAIKIFRADSQGRVSSDITIDHNTAVDHQATGQFLDLEGLATGITVTNNLFIAPNLQLGKSAAAPVYVGMNNLSAFRQISGNIWPDAQGLKLTNGGVNYIGASWGQNNAYQSVESWENYDVVQGDQFINVDEKSLDSLKIGPDTAGSTIRLAA
jgi:hypothetical protein